MGFIEHAFTHIGAHYLSERIPEWMQEQIMKQTKSEDTELSNIFNKISALRAENNARNKQISGLLEQYNLILKERKKEKAKALLGCIGIAILWGGLAYILMKVMG